MSSGERGPGFRGPGFRGPDFQFGSRGPMGLPMEDSEKEFNGDVYRGWDAMTEEDVTYMNSFAQNGLDQMGVHWSQYKEDGYRGRDIEASELGYYGVRSNSADAFGSRGFNSEFNKALWAVSETCEASSKQLSALRIAHQANEQRLLKIIDELNLALEEQQTEMRNAFTQTVFSSETSASIPNYIWAIIGCLGFGVTVFGGYNFVLRKKAYEVEEAKAEKVAYPRHSVIVEDDCREYSVSVDNAIETESESEDALETGV